MGLLDDAIREHLELKRRRGADPGEVARQESEALGDPRAPRRRTASPTRADAADEVRPVTPERTPSRTRRRGRGLRPADRGARRRCPSPTPSPGARTGARGRAPRPAPPPRGARGALAGGRAADGGAPRRPRPPGPAPSPRATTPPVDEDVLEETPDFLQETPEHDRLWFEQKPPRDFDFDN